MTPLEIIAETVLALGLIFFIIARTNKEEGYGGFTIFSLICVFFSIFCHLLNGFLSV